MTIVRGTVPEATLRRPRLRQRCSGRLAQPQFVARASAPVAVALVLAYGTHGRRRGAVAAGRSGGSLALIAYRRAIAQAQALSAAEAAHEVRSSLRPASASAHDRPRPGLRGSGGIASMVSAAESVIRQARRGSCRSGRLAASRPRE